MQSSVSQLRPGEGGLRGGRRDPPVGEAHPVLLDVQGGELLVVPQAFLLLTRDSQVETQHGVGLQLHRFTRLQT